MATALLHGFDLVDLCAIRDKLFEVSAAPIPSQITELKTKERRFTKTIEKTEAVDAVMEFIKK